MTQPEDWRSEVAAHMADAARRLDESRSDLAAVDAEWRQALLDAIDREHSAAERERRRATFWQIVGIVAGIAGAPLGALLFKLITEAF